jgi:hypothetical protein
MLALGTVAWLLIIIAVILAIGFFAGRRWL